MSSVSSKASSDSSSISGASHYDAPGDFDLKLGRGPANHVPDQYKNSELKPTFCVEWLEMMDDMDSPAPDHVVLRERAVLQAPYGQHHRVPKPLPRHQPK